MPVTCYSLCQESKPSTGAFINLIDKIVEENHDVRIPRMKWNSNSAVVNNISNGMAHIITDIDKQRRKDGYFNEESKRKIELYKDTILELSHM